MYNKIIFAILLTSLIACNQEQPTLFKKLISTDKKSLIAEAIDKQISEAITLKNGLYKNPYSLQAFYKQYESPVFITKNKPSSAYSFLLNFISKDAIYYGLQPKDYHLDKLNKLCNKINNATENNIIDNAQLELLCTDAFCQIIKNIETGRLYVDTNFRYNDTILNTKIILPALNKFAKQPSNLKNIVNEYEPKFADYDSLKYFLKDLIDSKDALNAYTKITLTADSVQNVNAILNRLNEEGFGSTSIDLIDSIGLKTLITNYQKEKSLITTGKIDANFIQYLNKTDKVNKNLIVLAIEKYRSIKTKHRGDYVMVNIPSYYLKAYKDNAFAIQSKVAVGKVASKTPTMESEISDIILMPKWFVPPSILKLPGYIDRKRRNPNYIVRGNQVIQKSGAGNALGAVKFNFKSGNAIYLHDTNEKWAFSTSKRAVSHGCVRVQDYTALASFLNSVTPLVEKNYGKRIDKTKVDSLTNDTSYTYRIVAIDSVVHKDNKIEAMLKTKAHHELQLQTKVPIYLVYITCAIKNGHYIQYNDVYNYDEALISKYINRL